VQGEQRRVQGRNQGGEGRVAGEYAQQQGEVAADDEQSGALNPIADFKVEIGGGQGPAEEELGAEKIGHRQEPGGGPAQSQTQTLQHKAADDQAESQAAEPGAAPEQVEQIAGKSQQIGGEGALQQQVHQGQGRAPIQG